MQVNEKKHRERIGNVSQVENGKNRKLYDIRAVITCKMGNPKKKKEGWAKIVPWALAVLAKIFFMIQLRSLQCQVVNLNSIIRVGEKIGIVSRRNER